MNVKKIGLQFCLLFSTSCIAQPQEIIEIADKYAGENAVVLKNNEHLVFKFEKNKLTAKSNISKEILLLNDLAPSIYNSTYIYHSSFHYLSAYEGFSHIPNKKDYKTLKATYIKSTKLESENVFYDDNQVTVLGYQGLVKYAKTETNYTLEHRELGFLPSFYFQNNIPTVESKFQITIPKGVSINTIQQYVDVSFLNASIEESKNTTTYTWVAKNIPRYKDYSNSPPSPAGFPHIIPYLTRYTLPNSDSQVQMIGDIKSLYDFVYKFISNTNKSGNIEIKKKALDLTKDCKDDICKAEKIYNWVQENIKYVAFEDSLGGFIPREGSLVLGRKYGDCKDMTSLLVSLYKAAGLQACYTWIGTRSRPYSIQQVPLPTIFNHMICAWKNNGAWVFIDGTHPSIKFGVQPHGIQGKDALISIDANHYEVVKVPEVDATKNLTIDSTWISINSQNEIEGKIKSCFSGFADWNMKSVLKYNNEEDKQKTIKSVCSRGSNKYFQKSGRYESSNENSCFYSDFSIKDYIQKIGKEVYINLHLERYNSNQKVDDIAQRNVPIVNKYKTIIKEVIVLQIPKNYTVSYLPSDVSHDEPNLWSYSIKYTKTNNQVICTKEYTEYVLYIMPSMFEKHNKLVSELNEHYKETVVLKAID